jgi:hypothetical protein
MRQRIATGVADLTLEQTVSNSKAEKEENETMPDNTTNASTRNAHLHPIQLPASFMPHRPIHPSLFTLSCSSGCCCRRRTPRQPSVTPADFGSMQHHKSDYCSISHHSPLYYASMRCQTTCDRMNVFGVRIFDRDTADLAKLR